MNNCIHGVAATTYCEKCGPGNMVMKPGGPAENLFTAAQTFSDRNKVYGDSFKKFGPVMVGMFPHGLCCKSIEDFNRLGAFVHCVDKLMRYASQFEKGGHKDSAHDLMPYAAILESLTKGD